jgi:hypothetical protein
MCDTFQWFQSKITNLKITIKPIETNSQLKGPIHERSPSSIIIQEGMYGTRGMVNCQFLTIFSCYLFDAQRGCWYVYLCTLP